MNATLRSAALTLLCTLAGGAAHAASFNCATLTTDAQELICSDPVLSSIDEEMAAAYQEALDYARVPVKVRNGQRRWVVGVRDRCDTVQCLKQAYEQRIDKLATMGWYTR